MVTLKNIKTFLSKYIDTDYFTRFFILLIVVYFFNSNYIALVDDRGMVYSSFLDKHLNYVAAIRSSIVYTSNAMAHLAGLDSHIYPPEYLRTPNGAWVEVAYRCAGLNLMSFWIAFVLSNREPIRKRFTWCLLGIICIWVINCCRVTLLLYAFDHRWKVNSVLNHHTQYNLVIYSVIIFMTYLYGQSVKRSMEKNTAGKLIL